MNVAVVILAAGESSRLGRPKARLTFKNETLLDRAIKRSTDAGYEPIVVWGATEYQTSARTVQNVRWREGMASSIAVGVAEAERLAAAFVLIVAVDQPLIEHTDLKALVDACPTDGASCAQWEDDGETVRGVPACFAASFYGALKGLEGDRGARSILRSEDETIVPVELPNAGFDVDDEDDLIRLRALSDD